MSKPFKFRPNRDLDGNGNTNLVRASRASAALDAYIANDRKDISHLQDLLCDLMHLADMKSRSQRRLLATWRNDENQKMADMPAWI
jgi:hypothetical protein